MLDRGLGFEGFENGGVGINAKLFAQSHGTIDGLGEVILGGRLLTMHQHAQRDTGVGIVKAGAERSSLFVIN